MALTDPEVEFESLILEAEGGTYRGHEGVREYFDLISEAFGGSWRTEITSIEEVGPDLLIIGSRSFATGKAGGVPVEQMFWQAGQTRGDKVVWWKFCRTRDEAVEAARKRQGG